MHYFTVYLSLAVMSIAVVITTTAKTKGSQALADQDQSAILRGVKTLRVSGEGCLMTVFGKQAFPLVAGVTRKNNSHPMGAGGTFGKGRMAGFTRGNFLYPEDPNTSNIGGTSDQNQFLLNLYRWLAGGKSPKATAVILDYKKDGAIDFLKNNDMNPTVFSLQELAKLKSLKGYDVVVIRDYITADHLPVLLKYLKSGGGIAAAFNTWNWLYSLKVDGEFATNFPPNVLSKNFGFVWRDDEGESRGWAPYPGDIFKASQPELADLTFPNLWRKVKSDMSKAVLDAKALQSVQALERQARSIPKAAFTQDPNIYSDAKKLVKSSSQSIPTEEKPLTSIPDRFKMLVFEALTSSILKPEDVIAHPSSAHFPGPVPKGAKRGSKHRLSILVNKKPDTRYTTGLYAEPGKVVKVTMDEYTGNNRQHFIVHVGGHTDNLLRKDKWSRAPILYRQASFVNGKAVINNPFGGNIYILSKAELEKPPASAQFTFEGAVAAPYFKLGETSVKQWQEVNRLDPAPWADLATEKVILNVRSEDIRRLDDPESLLRFWDQGLDACADLAVVPRDRPYAQLITMDVQPSAGWLHSGYPIVGRFKHSKIAVNLTELKSGKSWGLWHELGHNHQESAWSFTGSGEVTCNLFGLHVYDTLCNLKPRELDRDLDPPKYQPKVKNYIASNLNFTIWKDDPWLGLMYYIQLQEKFGWEAFKKVFKAYQNLPKDQDPKDDQAKMDLWAAMFSEVVGQNLYEFHKSWGFPISPSIADKLAKYPVAKMSIQDLL